ncbi:MAG: helix-turn-helix domain-containing protein, partial [Kiritimatiellae bacterium]|nr:helix-turn-helix domain-containing protein [Kiritimatiellia bacterium]
CAVYRPPSRGDLPFRQRHLAAWLAAQPRPLAVLAAYDSEARRVLDSCRVAGLGVPEDVAVLGVDNDPLRCETALPALSSVEMGGEEAGFAAAAALDAALRGRPGARRRIVLGGVRVEARASTARFLGRDPLVAKARAAIAERLGERLPVAALAKALGVSRRTLELRFRAEAGVPIGEAILGERLARAKDLLRTTTLPCDEIAAACGFGDASHLAHLFRRKFGASPSSFRKGS